MDSCCESKSGALARLRDKQSRVLKIVLAINAVMFFAEGAAGVVTRSSSVLADSLDMLGDAAVYASSLYVLRRGPVWQARMALAKGVVMVAFGLAVVLDVAMKLAGARVPHAEGMGLIGAVALGANLLCLYLLTRHRADDINMRSVWLCSRNDIVANVGVLVAAGAVAWSGSRWPDIAVGSVIAFVFLSSASRVLRDAAQELRAHRRGPAGLA